VYSGVALTERAARLGSPKLGPTEIGYLVDSDVAHDVGRLDICELFLLGTSMNDTMSQKLTLGDGELS
jgi:hypothetical protein